MSELNDMPFSSLEAQHQREMIRIHEAWQQTKAELAEAKAEVKRANAAIAPGQRDAAMQQMQALTIELRDKCRFTELQLAGAREECAKLATTTEELRAQLTHSQQSLAELSAVNSQQTPMIAELQGAAQRLTRERQEAIDRLREETRTYESLANTREQTTQLQEQKVHAHNEELRRALEAQRGAAAALDDANKRAVELERTNGELGRQLLSSKEQLKYLHLARRSEAQVQALLQQLQLDNARLVKLLAATDEYKEFVAYAEDSGGLTYVAPLPPSVEKSFLPEKGLTPRERAVRGAQHESEYWVPSDTYALANDFRRTHMPSLPMELFAELLLRLNRVWRTRESHRLERQRTKAQKKIGELRRRVAQAVPYEEVLQSSEMERLRRELKEMRVAFNTGRRKLNETEERLLESSLESAISIDSQLQQMTRQNEQLLAELAEHELRFNTSFSQGAAAAASSASETADRFGERVTELMREFQRKGMQLNRSDADLYTKVLQLQSWFLEGLDRRVVQCREKMSALYDTTMQAHTNQQVAAKAVTDVGSLERDSLDAVRRSGGSVASATRAPPPGLSPPFGNNGRAARAYESAAGPLDDDSDDFGD